MAVAPLIAMKSTKCESLEAVGRELDRRAHTYVSDVDPTRRHVGYVCRAGDEHPMPLERAVERRMGELRTKRAVRKDAVKAMGFIVSSNDALDEKAAREFLDKSVRWFGARYGYANLLAAQIHLDEGTPHAHIWVAPVMRGTDGYDRLCAKELFAPDKRRRNPETGKWEVVAQGTMSQLQQDFWREVASGYGYERPLDHANRAKGYRSLEAFKSHEGVTRSLRRETAGLEFRRDRARETAEHCEAEAAKAAALRDRRRGELGAIEAEVAEKRSVAADLSEQISQKTAELAKRQARLDDFSQKTVEAQRRLESVQEAVASVEEELRESEQRAEWLGQARGEAQARVRGLERRAGGLRDAIGRVWDELVERVRSMDWQVQVPPALRWVCERLSDAVAGLGWEGGWWGRVGPVEAQDGISGDEAVYDLDDMLSDARASADAYNRDHGGWEPTTPSYAPSYDNDGER